MRFIALKIKGCKDGQDFLIYKGSQNGPPGVKNMEFWLWLFADTGQSIIFAVRFWKYVALPDG